MKITNIPSGALSVNTYLVVDEATNKGFIVDPGGYNHVLTMEVNNENIDIEYIILTHGHADHICGVNEHRKEFDAQVIACKAEEPMLLDEEYNHSASYGLPTTVEADIFVDDGDQLQIGNLNLEFIATPGHTPGGMCIYVTNEHTLFSGDTLFRQSIGRTDFQGSSYRDIMDSIKKKLFKLPDETSVFPGHMGATTIGFEKENNPFV